jgi:hypothetical protein
MVVRFLQRGQTTAGEQEAATELRAHGSRDKRVVMGSSEGGG